jgi:glycosyltransferase involved in cell wall biosynthesis
VQVLTGGDVGGGQLVSLRVSGALAAHGWTIRFATPSLGDVTPSAEAIGSVDIVRENSVRDIPRVRRIARYLEMVDASLVHTHTPVAAALLWRLGARLAGVRVIHHVHSANFYGPPGVKSAITRTIDRQTAGVPLQFIAVSRNTAESVIADGYPAERVTTIYNAIPWEKAPRFRPHIDSVPVIGCVGRVSRMKGQLELVEAFAILRAKYPRAILRIIGPVQDGEERYLETIESRAQSLGVADAVEILGYRDDVREAMRDMTVLALPSRHEAFPLAILEAASIGVPVVATAVGGVGELIEDRVSGLTVEPGSVHQLSGALDELLGDVFLRERLSARAYDEVWSRFSDELTLDRVVSVIEDGAMRANRD